MEHRYTDRGSVKLNVVVSCPRIGLVRGVATNIGIGGIFVATDCAVVPLNAPVTISFQTGAGNNVACLHIPGMVVHQDISGVGVMFDDLEPSCSTAIRQFLADCIPDAPSEKSKRLATA